MKKVLMLLTTVVMAFTMSVSSVGAQGLENKGIQQQSVMNELTEISEKYDVEIITDNIEIPKGERIKFDSFEEFEAFLSSFSTNDDSTVNKLNFNSISPLVADTTTPINSNTTLNWWAPFSGWGMSGLACWKNISFDYAFTLKDGLKSLSNIDSYLSGLQVAVSWKQTSKSYNIYKNSSGNGANININGYYLLGFDVMGFEIGAKINDSWSKTFEFSKSV